MVVSAIRELKNAAPTLEMSGPMKIGPKTKRELIDDDELARVRLGGDGGPLCD
jgi:hypothetical protein